MSEPVLPVSESFIIAVVGCITASLGLFLSCLLKSRCYRIRICGIECDRQVVPSEDLARVNIEMPPIVQ